MTTSSRVIFVAGGHRCGTSMVTAAVNAAGAVLTDSLLKASDDNKKGYFEDKTILKINENMLARKELRWDAIIVEDRHLLLDIDDDIYARISDFFEKLNFDNGPVVVKDPRFSLTLPAWLSALKTQRPDVGAEIVVPFRSGFEAAISEHKRALRGVAYHFQGRDPRLPLLSWLIQYCCLVNYLAESETKALFVSYASMMTQPEHELKRIRQALQLNGADEQLLDYASNFVDSSLQRNRQSQNMTTGTSRLEQYCFELLALLNEVSLAPMSVSVSNKKISVLAEKIIEASELFGSLQTWPKAMLRSYV